MIKILGFVFMTEERFESERIKNFELGYDTGKFAQKHNTGVVRDPVTGRFVSADKCSNLGEMTIKEFNEKYGK